MTTKRVKLKLGLAEVEIEGEQDDLHDQALKMLEQMVELVPVQPIAETKTIPSPNTMEALEPPEAFGHVANEFDFSIDMIATHLDSKTATDLAEVACAFLHFVKGEHEFDRSEILDAMKSATSFYKGTMSGNLSKTLKSLVKNGSLLARPSGKYALSNKARQKAEGFLGEIG